MNKIIVDSDIHTEEQPSAIVVDALNSPSKGEKGDKGDKGERGEKGEKGDRGEQGIAGKDGRDGIDGANGKDGRDGRDGIDGKNGKNGRDGERGPVGPKGDTGQKGKDGTVWYLFLSQVDDKKGKEGDLCIVQTTSNFYRKEKHEDELIWKFKGNLKGKDGEAGKDGSNGRDGGGGGYSINFIYKRGVVLKMFDSVMIPAKGNDRVLVLEIPNFKAADLLKVDLSGENIGQFEYGIQSDLNDDLTFDQIGVKRTNFTKYNEQVDLARITAQGPTYFVVKAINPRASNAMFDATVFYDLYDSVVLP